MKRAAIAVLIGIALVYSIGAWLMFTADTAHGATPCRSIVHRAHLAGADEEQPAGGFDLFQTRKPGAVAAWCRKETS